jgi:arginyl-tRNA synthetase
VRFFLISRKADTEFVFDIDLALKASDENPVFYVQYAHARTCAVARNAATAGVDRSVFQAELLDHQTEADLANAIANFPRVVAQSATLREPHRVARYLEELAAFYHRWYDNCRVTPIGDADVNDAHRTRLWLNDASGQVLRNGLGLLGVSAPERM